jgi:hypothetical protein
MLARVLAGMRLHWQSIVAAIDTDQKQAPDLILHDRQAS